MLGLRPRAALLLAALVALAACEPTTASAPARTPPAPSPPPSAAPTHSPRPTDPQAPAREIPTAAAPATIRIATFNIQNFGPKKAGDDGMLATLAGIVRKYDVVAVQEIQDAKEAAPRKLLSKVNESGRYELLLSPRSGEQPDDRTSQEQYAFFFNTGTIEALPDAGLYEDVQDLFQREPYVARFQVRGARFTFVLINIHTQPKAAVAEIAALDEVTKWASRRFAGERHFISLGDFNASCSYAKPAELDGLALRGAGYFWMVPDDADSNLSDKACAYDRIVGTVQLREAFAGRWGVDRAFDDKAVSDHWPVWAEFTTGAPR